MRVLPSTLAFVALVAASALITGCGGTATSPSSAPFSQLDLRVGTGAEAVNGSVLTVNYTGWLYDASKPDQKGLQFTSSIGGTPFTFTLGAGGVITGWDLGVPGMKVGGLRRLVIPPSLGYGAARYGPIPPYATLVFEIELLDVQAPGSSPTLAGTPRELPRGHAVAARSHQMRSEGGRAPLSPQRPMWMRAPNRMNVARSSSPPSPPPTGTPLTLAYRPSA